MASLKENLEQEADKKGLTGKEKDRYIGGTINKIKRNSPKQQKHERRKIEATTYYVVTGYRFDPKKARYKRVIATFGTKEQADHDASVKRANPTVWRKDVTIRKKKSKEIQPLKVEPLKL